MPCSVWASFKLWGNKKTNHRSGTMVKKAPKVGGLFMFFLILDFSQPVFQLPEKVVVMENNSH